jgi:hypothetical protein
MDARSPSHALRHDGVRRSLALAGCAALALIGASHARADVQQTGGSQTPVAGSPPASQQQGVSATLEQCQTALAQTERSATFAGEMSAIPGAGRMQMRVDVQERLPDEARFHTIRAPGLGVWRSSAPGVKAYKYLKQVTNLSAPALYRAAVRFRWLNAQGRLIKALERHTPACSQPAPPSEDVTPEAPPEATHTSAGGSAATGTSAPAPVAG